MLPCSMNTSGVLDILSSSPFSRDRKNYCMEKKSPKILAYNREISSDLQNCMDESFCFASPFQMDIWLFLIFLLFQSNKSLHPRFKLCWLKGTYVLNANRFPCKITSPIYKPTIRVTECPLEDMLDNTWCFQSLKFYSS